MIITIAIVLLTATLITISVVADKTSKKIEFGEKSETLERVGIACFVLSWFASAIAGAMIGCSIGNNLPQKAREIRIKYDNDVYSLNATYKTLEKADDSWAKYTAVQQYNEAVKEFKTDIETNKAIVNNPFISWFTCYIYAELDPNSVSFYEF